MTTQVIIDVCSTSKNGGDFTIEKTIILSKADVETLALQKYKKEHNQDLDEDRQYFTMVQKIILETSTT